MADQPAGQAPPPRSRGIGGFSITNPGAKEYAIVFVVVLGLAYWYFKHKQSQAGSTAGTANQPSQGSPVVLAGNGGGGVPFGALFAALQNHQSSPAAASPTTDTVPNLQDLSYQQAVSSAAQAGFSTQAQGPTGQGATVSAQRPSAGTKVTQGQKGWPTGQPQPVVTLTLAQGRQGGGGQQGNDDHDHSRDDDRRQGGGRM